MICNGSHTGNGGTDRSIHSALHICTGTIASPRWRRYSGFLRSACHNTDHEQMEQHGKSLKLSVHQGGLICDSSVQGLRDQDLNALHHLVSLRELSLYGARCITGKGPDSPARPPALAGTSFFPVDPSIPNPSTPDPPFCHRLLV